VLAGVWVMITITDIELVGIWINLSIKSTLIRPR